VDKLINRERREKKKGIKLKKYKGKTK